MNPFRRGRSVPAPVQEPRHTSANPLFSPELQNPWVRFRAVTLGATILILFVGGLGWYVFGPWTRLTGVSVAGTVFVTPTSVQKYGEYALSKRWLGLFPIRQRLFFNQRSFARSVTKKINERISILGVSVAVVGSHTVHLTVRERLPVALWTVESTTGWLDGDGRIVSLGAAPPGTNLPIVEDEGRAGFSLNEQVVDPGVVTAILTLNDALNSSGFTVETYRLPVPACLVVPIKEETTNSNLNASNKNANGNTNSSANQNVNGQANTNSATTPTLPCDQTQLRLKRPEIDLQLVDGPVARFDRYTDLNHAVGTLKTLLTDPKNSSSREIDLRFSGRVYIK